jgi:hypothetical protein
MVGVLGIDEGVAGCEVRIDSGEGVIRSAVGETDGITGGGVACTRFSGAGTAVGCVAQLVSNSTRRKPQFGSKVHVWSNVQRPVMIQFIDSSSLNCSVSTLKSYMV